MNINSNPKVVFKILVLGDAMVGKSSVLQRYTDDSFSDSVAPTIGVDYRPAYREIKGETVKLMIWDTAGQEKFKSITKAFYRGAHGALIVYDVEQKATLFALPKWIEEVKSICGPIPSVIVGNKWDSKTKSHVSEDEIKAYIEEIGFSDKHFLISAYTGENVDKAFTTLAELLMDQHEVFTANEELNIMLHKKKKTRNCPC